MAACRPQAFVTVSATPNVSITNDHIEQPESKSLNVGLSRELRPNLAVHVDGVFSKGTKASQIANVNTPDPVTGVRPRPTWGNIIEYRSAGESEYRALYLRLDKRFSDRYQYLVSYTLANDKDQGAGQATVVDFYHPEYDDGCGQPGPPPHAGGERRRDAAVSTSRWGRCGTIVRRGRSARARASI